MTHANKESLKVLRAGLYRSDKLKYKAKLGKGGQGHVYRFRSSDSGNSYAVKLFKDIRNFRRERDVLYALSDNPNFIQIAGECEFRVGDVLCGAIVMELGDACLFDVVREDGPMHEDTAKKHGFALLQALKAMHKKSMFHNDIKLENLLLAKDGTLRLADFGLVTRDALHLRRKGTKNYMAPEMLCGDFPCSAGKVDAWCAGVAIFSMLIGGRAFITRADASDPYFRLLRDDVDAFIEEHLQHRAVRSRVHWVAHLLKRFSRFNVVSSEAKSFFSMALKIDPEERKTVTELLEHPWFSSLY
jgi:serine/threonine protein kinase